MPEKKFKEYGKHDSTQSQNWNILHLSNNSVATLPSRPEIQTTPWDDKCNACPLMRMDGMNPSGLPGLIQAGSMKGKKHVVVELIASDSVPCLAELFIRVGFGSEKYSFLIQLHSNRRLPCNTENLKHAPECKF